MLRGECRGVWVGGWVVLRGGCMGVGVWGRGWLVTRECVFLCASLFGLANKYK